MLRIPTPKTERGIRDFYPVFLFQFFMPNKKSNTYKLDFSCLDYKWQSILVIFNSEVFIDFDVRKNLSTTLVERVVE